MAQYKTSRHFTVNDIVVSSSTGEYQLSEYDYSAADDSYQNYG